MAKLSARASRPAKTVLSDVKPQKLNYITGEQAAGIMALLDEWIDECESYCNREMDVPDGHPEPRQIAAECLHYLAYLKEYRSTLQSSEQSWHALVMLEALTTATLKESLTHKYELLIKPARARLKKIEKEIQRSKFLSKRIEERKLSADDLLGSGKKPKRTKLLDEYRKEFVKKTSRTFTADVKKIFDLAD